MTYPLEKDGTIITNRDEFHKKFCENCKYKEICFEWSFKTGMTLYSNRTKAGQRFVADDGTEGVFRCSMYEEEGYKSIKDLVQNCSPEEFKKLQKAFNDHLVRGGGKPIPFSERE